MKQSLFRTTVEPEIRSNIPAIHTLKTNHHSVVVSLSKVFGAITFDSIRIVN